ncbi:MULTISPECIES: zinc dependent phospholipase C family protein [unclassified Treponema]|uniref:zinc dependent phospholipase C family protein n=1 Tax=unclassified Treponema TaxID=2638727 RepID=UPI0020A25244|nr:MULTISPECIES: zinc dependent phospholipase C family protein [unclassified Treponema]UTC68418.1 zinc dependent phospholipase C family protein [Treponema sp. OMZ 789]UTC68561.1 zinc dependent phospholipase C family protein [Treponema sp. OMZ 790]UTC71291.1 zinc dependent phospholipase C family protein [Treponema sp. OMZ 791]
MPDFYSHYAHGQKVFDLLPAEIKGVISNRNLYNLGLQGPDFLYFHKPFKKNDNPVLDLASDIHNKNCTDFFNSVLNKITIRPNTDEFSYIMGFVGHFGLDSCCHPYVNSMVTEMNLNHAEIEMEFEKFLLKEDGKPPFKYKAHQYINITKKEAEAVAAIYRCLLPSLTVDDILLSFSTFKKGKHFFYAPTDFSQKIRLTLFKLLGLYDFLNGHIMKTADHPQSKITNKKLFSLYNNSIQITAELMDNFYKKLIEDKPLLDRFNYNFA